MKINVGCGKRILEGFVNVDLFPQDYGDKLVELSKLDAIYLSSDARSLPFSDNSVDYILADHVLEHFLVEEGYEVLWEFHRVLKVGGLVEIFVPNFEYWINCFPSYERDCMNSVDMEYAILCNVREKTMLPHRSLWWSKRLVFLMERIGFVDFLINDSASSLQVKSNRSEKRSVDCLLR